MHLEKDDGVRCLAEESCAWKFKSFATEAREGSTGAGGCLVSTPTRMGFTTLQELKLGKSLSQLI